MGGFRDVIIDAAPTNDGDTRSITPVLPAKDQDNLESRFFNEYKDLYSADIIGHKIEEGKLKIIEQKIWEPEQ